MPTKKTPSKKKTQTTDLSICRVCGNKILVSIFKNTGLCCVNCEKHERNEKVIEPVIATTDCA